METNQIKKFAIEARNILKTGVLNKITSLGFDAHGKVEEKNKPLKVQPGAIFMGTHIADDTFYDKWISLYERVQQKGVKEVCEEAAYTWFNRLMAIRIMQKNGFISPILAYESEIVHIPHIVAEARRGILPTMTEDNRRALLEYMEDDNKVTEQFTYLIIAFCQFNPVLKACFGNVNDYTELLLPKNILAEGGFIDLLNHTDFISDEDYCSPELIGWLYQFYISEKKDEVFASFKKSKKAETEDIPAATQIFTPNWIVKYMVQNTIGRIYLDNNPYSSLAEQMKYLVEPSEPTPQEAKLVISDIETMKMIDPACGSGHILIEAFDLFYQMYQEEGYSRRQAVEAILTKNLLGIDLDTRAKQLAMFALLMAACKKDTYFLEANILPQVLDMSGIPVLYDRIKNDLSDILLTKDNKVLNELMDAMKLLQQADNLGSIMKFDISEVTREIIVRRLAEYKTMGEMPIIIRNFLSAFRLILALTDKYTGVVANPPYMGAGNMNPELTKYVKDNYEDGKSDLFSVFMYVSIQLLAPQGKLGMINMQSWMFLSSFEKLRKFFLDNYQIDNMLHLGPRTFDEISGEIVQNTAFVISKTLPRISGMYYRLIEGKNCKEKENMYLKGDSKYIKITQKDFEKIPGCPMGYWASTNLIKSFSIYKPLELILNPRQGLKTLNNESFTRLWFEVDKNKLSFKDGKKWFPFNNGGGFRKWFGLNDTVVNWENDGYEIKKLAKQKYNSITRTVTNLNSYFIPGITWSVIASGSASFRMYEKGFIFSNSGQCMISNDENLRFNIIGLLNSKITNSLLSILSPTIGFESGYLKKLPVNCSDK
ncbi:BREX-1 system adenine-specific DNA-methyltransferase PglX, partial [Bacteroides thetaiotaomicron]